MDRIDNLMTKKNLKETMAIYRKIKDRKNHRETVILKRMILTAAYISGLGHTMTYPFFLKWLKAWDKNENATSVMQLMDMEIRLKSKASFYRVSAETIINGDDAQFYNELYDTRKILLIKKRNETYG